MTRYAYVNGIILDGTEHMEPQTGRAVIVEDGKITDIVESLDGIVGCEVVDLGGRYLLPGLINMHVHLAGNGKPQKKQRDNTALVEKLFSNPVSAAVAH